MTLSRQILIKISAILFLTSQTYFETATAADTSNFLVIGRPEQGGVNFEQALQNFPQLLNARAWYIDPYSQGDSSLAQPFPCAIPSSMPSQYPIVCIEQGMLNEVCLHAQNPALETRPTIESSTPAHDVEQDLKTLNIKQESARLLWRATDEEIDALNRRIISAALIDGLLKESLEHGNIYYCITINDDKNTFGDKTIINRLFSLKDIASIEQTNLFTCIAPFAQELQQLKQTREYQYADWLAIVNVTSKLEKLLHSEEGNNLPEAHVAPTFVPASTNNRTPSEVYAHIQNFVVQAWDLVSPNGTMIIFSSNAQIADTDLSNGISLNFLTSSLTDYAEIKEIPFSAQNNEGDLYIANPAIPATVNTMSWGGPRAAGSYFLIKKLR